MKKISDRVEDLKTGNRRKDRIEVFNFVRDIPYFGSHNDNPIDAMEENKGNCGQKARLLRMMLEELGENVKMISARYRVENLPLPQEITDIWLMECDYHLAVLIEIEGGWKLLDATADGNLRRSGFVVNEWDGKSNTNWYVRPEEVSYRGSGNEEGFGENLEEWLDKLSENKTRTKEFTRRENEYLKKVRESNFCKIKNLLRNKLR